MTPSCTNGAADPTPEVGGQSDLTGRNRMAWNVIVSWAGQFVFIAAGFVMPRMIDHRLGRDTLGIWDFSWSMVAYFGLIQVGVGSSVDRYIAKYRVRGEITKISEVVCSIGLLMALMGLAIVGLAVLLSSQLPVLWGEQLGEGIGDAQVVLITLGMSLAVEVAFASFSGVITGCHRWDIHNYIKSGWHLMVVVSMIVLLLLGLGIKALALASLVGLCMTNLTRVVFAFWLCPGMRIGHRFVRWRVMRDALGFGVKTLGPRIGDLLLNQTSGILVASFLGPGALALYSRPKSLTQHTGMLVNKLAFVLTPTASALHSINRQEELEELLVTATRYAAFISLPITVILSLMGGPLMLWWMGPDYADEILVMFIAVGSFTMSTFMPAMSILTGLNAHGRPGIAHFSAAICSVGLVLLALGPLKLGLRGVALAMGFPLTMAYGIYISTYVCRQLRISWGRFMSEAFRTPIFCVLPLAVSGSDSWSLSHLFASHWGLVSVGVLRP